MVDFNSVAYVTGLAAEVGALFWLVNASVWSLFVFKNISLFLF